MDGYLSNKPDNFVDDPEKLYRLRRREAHQAKKLDFVDSKSEDKGSKESPKNSPPQSPRENRLPPMGDQPLERKIGEIIDLPILSLEEIGRPFEIKTSTIRMVQHSPFTGKEDLNLHLQAFIQLCQTFNMDGVTQDQMRARPRAKVLSRTHHGVKDDHRCIGGRIYHRAYTDGSFHSIQEGRG
jgi:hypothetical protein